MKLTMIVFLVAIFFGLAFSLHAQTPAPSRSPMPAITPSPTPIPLITPTPSPTKPPVSTPAPSPSLIDSNILAAAIGLVGAIIGGLITACVAFRIAKMSFRRDTVSAILELFEQTHSDVLAEFALVMSKSRVADLPAEKREQAERDLLPFTKESIARYSRIGASFGVIRAKVIMLKSRKALEALTEYMKYFTSASDEASQRRLSEEVIVQTMTQLRFLAKPFQAALVEIADL